MNILCLTTGNSYSSHRKHDCHVNGEKNEEVPQFQRLIIGQKYTKSDDRTLHLSILLLMVFHPVCHSVHWRYVWGREHELELICIGYFMLTC